ncbi:MAG: FHA domain-containing protein [Lentisphaeria bacterium]|nr:FHA domain-containing protein [Lentisphaeria bacterium]
MASLDYVLERREKHLELKTGKDCCIGSDPDCQVRLEGLPRVSRRHCSIHFNPSINAFALADLYSTDGTFLNGRKIGSLDVPLRDGDKIAVGPIELVFRSAVSSATESFRTDTVRIPTSAKPNPFSIAAAAPAPERSRCRKGEQLLDGETVLETLEPAGPVERCLTVSRSGERHLLKIFRDPPQDLSAGRELKNICEGLPRLTGLLPVLRAGSLEDGGCFLLFEYQEAPTYAKMISMLSPMPQTHALALVYSVGIILARVWQNGVFHGDLTPDDILYSPKTGGCIAGAGLAAWRERFFPDLADRPAQWYAAPETSAGKSVWQSDQYALGIMLFQLLTGVLPFRADTARELAAMHREQTMPLPQERNPQIQTLPAVNAAVFRMTMKDPSERYESWEQLLADLGRINSSLKQKEKETGKI